MKIIKQVFLCCVCIFSCMTLSGCEEEKNPVIQLSQQEKRLKDHKYDFIDFVTMTVRGPDTGGIIEDLELKKPELEDFESEEDFIRIKEIFTDAELSVSKNEDLKNGDKVSISISSSVSLSDSDLKLINLESYTYTVNNLEKGKKVDLFKDINYTIYTLEGENVAKQKAKNNPNYAMRFIPVVHSTGLDEMIEQGINFKIMTDENIVTYDNTIASVDFGLPKFYLVDKNIVLANNKDNPLQCDTWNSDYKTCYISRKNVMKEEHLATPAKWSSKLSVTEADKLLYYLQSRIDYLSSSAYSDIDADLDSLTQVLAVYKINETDNDSSDSLLLAPYRHMIVLKGKDEYSKDIYVGIEVGCLETDNGPGFFSVNDNSYDVINISYNLNDISKNQDDLTFTKVSEV